MPICPFEMVLATVYSCNRKFPTKIIITFFLSFFSSPNFSMSGESKYAALPIQQFDEKSGNR